MVLEYVSFRRKQPQKKKRKVALHAKGSNPETKLVLWACTRVWNQGASWSNGMLQGKWLFSVKTPFSCLIFHCDPNTPQHYIILGFQFIWWYITSTSIWARRARQAFRKVMNVSHLQSKKKRHFLQVQNLFLSIYRKSFERTLVKT